MSLINLKTSFNYRIKYIIFFDLFLVCETNSLENSQISNEIDWNKKHKKNSRNKNRFEKKKNYYWKKRDKKSIFFLLLLWLLF